MPTSQRHPRELLGGYVLGALERREAALVRRHLRRCWECRTTYERLANLPSLIDLLEPSEEGAPEPPTVAGDPVRERARWRRRPWRQPPLHWRTPGGRSAPLVLAVAALAAALALVGSLSSGDDRKTILLRGAASTGIVQLKPSLSGTRVRLRAEGLAATRGDQVYEVWFISGGRRMSAGTFTVGPSGRTDVELTTAARARDYDRIDVTHEAVADDRRRPGRSVLDGVVRY
jgi:anti-sigma-K factor RskA